MSIITPIYDEKISQNIFSLENLDQINENNLLRAPKKGKIIKGPNWTAYKRQRLGIIPQKTENVIIQNVNNNPRGFSSQSGRFGGRSETIKYSFPSPGTYSKCLIQSELNTSVTRPDTSYSNKGFSNGFVSSAERFDEPKLYYSKYFPGPGQYKIDEKYSIKAQINKKLNYKSLYDNSCVKSLKIKHELPGPGYYTFKELNHLKKVGLSSFVSSASRFEKDNKNSVPGPGKYFKNWDHSEKNNSRSHTCSHFFRESPKEKENFDNLVDKYIDNNKNYEIKTNFRNLQFKRILKKKKKLNIKINSLSNKLLCDGLIFDCYQPLINKKRSDNVEKRILDSSIVKNTLQKNIRKETFESSAERWNNANKKIPGPAYYNIKISPKKTNFFNKTDTRWI